MLRYRLARWGAMASLVLLILGVGGEVHAQSPEDAGMIHEIRPNFATALTLGRGDRVLLAVTVLDSDGVEHHSLDSEVDITWTASDGGLEVHLGTTRAMYTAPLRSLGSQTVTASAGSACVGNTADCTATFTIRVLGGGPCYWRNPPALPTALIDAEGHQYKVFAPRGGRIDGSDFRLVATCGQVPDGEYIGVRMFQNGPASNAGMSHHTYTLSGNQYDISIVDAEVRPIASYDLKYDVEVCIPIPDELHSNLWGIVMVNQNNDGTLTEISSSVLISPSLIICGYTSKLPATVAVGIPGTPPEMLPATGGAVPASRGIIAWAFVVGFALLSTGAFTFARRRRQERSR